MIKLTFSYLFMLELSNSYSAIVANFDIVEDYLKLGSNYLGGGNYDFLDASTGNTGADGVDDISAF